MRSLQRILIVVLVLALAGCGWHLRGSAPGTASLEGVPVVVDSQIGQGELIRELRRTLAAAGADVRSSGDGARLVIESESRDRQQLSVAAGGGTEEYEVRYRVRWSIRDGDGDTLAGPDTFEQIREYRFDREAVLGSEEREEALIEELRRDVAFLLTERVQATLGE
ncbi:LPS assembly lipoprotein LptE [Aquisalimonas asiatica]|uniref:LPS-assembly lipoprotein LptE n=1 Tax=Aquisalimonas asiatica TaxID=406100 RepID=A0A1H8SAA2_9GAMM|nr:LPS assembly lipoprotein LptE [Aquisalimonas asiatica]SEO75487.1 LPS-assembly lipoprotein [Aquisalimonas asiatica]